MTIFNSLLISGALCAAVCTRAQTIHGVAGASARMQGDIGSVSADAFSSTNNPAQLSWLARWQAGAYAEQRFLLKELTLSGVSFGIPSRFIDLGAAMNHYGFSDFSQQRFTLSASRKLAPAFSLGVQLNYLRTAVREYGAGGAFVLAAGVSFRPAERIGLAFMLYNPNQQQLSDKVADPVPAYARLGIGYKVNEKVQVSAEAEQQTMQRTRFHAGVRYEPAEKLALAIGVSGDPVLFSFGTSVKAAGLIMDMGAGIHPVLGVIPMASLRFPASNR